jgi:hypothetical protein
VFGPPDLSLVDGAVTIDDTATEPSGSTDTDPTGDTATEEPFERPAVVDFQLRRFADRLGFAFAVVDADQDVLNGLVTLTSDVPGSQPLIFAIPGDLDVWEPLGRSVITLPQAWIPCDGLVETWHLTVTDAAGHVGPTADRELVINGLGLVAEGELYDFGWLGEPTVACVEFNWDPSIPAPAQQQLAADREDLRFVAVTDGDYSFELAWQNIMNADLFLYESGSTFAAAPPVPEFGSAWESFVFPLVADRTYVLSPQYYALAGNEPPYVATVLMGPAVE